MQTPLSRRAWITSIATASAAATFSHFPIARAGEGLPRTGPSRMKLSLAAYSFRDFFKDGVDRGMDMLKFIDYCAEQRCDAEVTSYYFPKTIDNGYLVTLKRHAFLRGVALSGSAIGNTFTHPAGPERDKEMALAKKWIDHCQAMGAPHIRIFAGSKPRDISHEDAVRNCIETTRLVCEYAGERGVFLGIENHGGIVEQADTLLEIVRAVKSPWLGINLDSGNFRTADPYADFAKCAPLAVNVQIKTEVSPKGEKSQRADFKRFIKILREANYQGFVALEFEEKADPYATVPGVLNDLRKAIEA